MQSVSLTRLPAQARLRLLSGGVGAGSVTAHRIRSGECLLQAFVECPFETLPSILLLVDLTLRRLRFGGRHPI